MTQKHPFLCITIMRPHIQHQAIYLSLLCHFLSIVFSVTLRHNYMYMSYILHIRRSSLLICASLNETAKLGLLDRSIRTTELYWNFSKFWSVQHNITEVQRTRLHYTRSLISCMLLLVFLWSRGCLILITVSSNLSSLSPVLH